jgi:hypothetical protein
LPAFNLPQGISVTIVGNHHTLDANGTLYAHGTTTCMMFPR